MAEEAKKQQNIARQLAANRAMISIFADNEDYEKCFQRYDSISSLLTTQANAAAAGKSKAHHDGKCLRHPGHYHEPLLFQGKIYAGACC